MNLAHKLKKFFNFLLKAFLEVSITGAIALRPLLGPAGCCRFRPTCTRYAREQLAAETPLAALSRIMLRVLSCQPLSGLFTQK